MKPIFTVAVIVSVLIASGIFMAGDFSVARVGVPQPESASGLAPRAAASDRTVTLQVDNMYCASCPYIIMRSLAAVPGVKNVSVSFRNKTALVIFDSARTNVAALTDATFNKGYLSEIKGR